MMAYSSQVLSHFENPLNVGRFDSSIENVVSCWVVQPYAVLKLSARIENGIFKDTRMKVQGNPSAVAVMSYMSEILKGKTFNEARQITSPQISEALNLAPVDIYLSILAVEALRKLANKLCRLSPKLNMS